ncbi:MAG: hypothetical protein Q3986_02230 [Akkermansia sp.]|nr:hypothetical protein [Akkermansia sp.]
MPDVSDIPEIPEVSTEAQRQALDAMSEELVQKLNRMIEEQDARVKAFAVQNPSLSSLPVTPDPIVLPQVPPQPQKPSVPKPAALTTEQVLDEYDRQWAKEKREQPLQTPPVPPLSRPKPKRQRQVAPNQEEKQSSNIGSWVFFIVIVLIILRACTEA